MREIGRIRKMYTENVKYVLKMNVKIIMFLFLISEYAKYALRSGLFFFTIR